MHDEKDEKDEKDEMGREERNEEEKKGEIDAWQGNWQINHQRA